MFKAVIFDFNGVLADDEPIHLEAFQFAAAEAGVRLTEAEYLEHYMPLNDWELFRNLYRDRRRELDAASLETLVERKVRRYYEILEKRGARSVLFPGAAAAIDAAAALGPVAIASGARREEIDGILESGGLRERVSIVVAAEDVERSKPDPEPFLKAAARLNEKAGQDLSAHYLAIEDSRGGIIAAKAAGLRCLAVEHSYDRSELTGADWVIPSIGAFNDWLTEEVSA